MQSQINGIKEKPSFPSAHQENTEKKMQNLVPEGESLKCIQNDEDNNVLEDRDQEQVQEEEELKNEAK